MNGRSKIYAESANRIDSEVKEALGVEVDIKPERRIKKLRFHGEDFIKGNLLFRVFILKPDMQNGIELYNKRR
jgi:omega-amidase